VPVGTLEDLVGAWERDRSTTGAGPRGFPLTETKRVNVAGQWALTVDGQSACSKGRITMRPVVWVLVP
jgi:hypothetical protein